MAELKDIDLNDVAEKLREVIPHSFLHIESISKSLTDPLHVEIMKDSILAADTFLYSLPKRFSYLNGETKWEIPIQDILLELIAKLFITEGNQTAFNNLKKHYELGIEWSKL